MTLSKHNWVIFHPKIKKNKKIKRNNKTKRPYHSEYKLNLIIVFFMDLLSTFNKK